MASSPILSSILLFIFSFLLTVNYVSIQVDGQSSIPSFACDIDKDSSLVQYGFCNTSLDTSYRVADLVNRLTLKEKVGFLVNSASNVSRLGIPSYEWWSEILHGVADWFTRTRFTDVVPGATSFPLPILTSASFNISLFNAIGKVVSTEARAMHNVGLTGLTFWSPVINILRDPRWGRAQETSGEDPMLTSLYAEYFVKGLQQTEDGSTDRLKVAACCKHYTAYDLDNWNHIQRYSFNAVVSKQDLDDTFQPPFKGCVLNGNVASVMCSYNQVNGKPTCADQDLLEGVVRGQWNLNGYIVTDCDSIQVMFEQQNYTKTPEESAAKALIAGVDLNCGSFLANYTERAVETGLVNESVIDRAISNNFATLMRLGFFDGNPSKQQYGQLGPKDVCTSEHQELARDAARQGIVLLKNNKGTLPLSTTKIKTLAVIGPNANATDTMLGNYRGVPCKYTTPLQGLTELVSTTFEPGCPDIFCNIAQIDKARQIAAKADATIVVVGADLRVEAETLDRTNILLPGQQQLLVTEVAEASKGPVILVIMSAGGMDISFAKSSNRIAGILWVGYPGEAGGAALADVIFGYYNPSGKLPATWYPESYLEKVPMTNMNMRPDHSTGYPGRTYRFYTGETVYPFGYGLSYTNFQHQIRSPQALSLSLPTTHSCHSSNCFSVDAHEQVCKSLALDVHVRVKNLGSVSGSNTVLLFSTPPAVHNSPQKQLVAFEKVSLEPQKVSVVKFKIDVCNDLSVADEEGNRKIPLGEHVFQVGDVKQSLTVRI